MTLRTANSVFARFERSVRSNRVREAQIRMPHENAEPRKSGLMVIDLCLGRLSVACIENSAS